MVEIFGHGKDLNTLQMACRGVVVFLIALVLIRLSGRRSFGLRTPLDNIVMILLGAILSRAVVGASGFLPIVAASTVIVLIHRVFGHLAAKNKRFARLVEGDKMLLYKQGKFIRERMTQMMVSEEDITQALRKSVNTESLENIESIYMERNGEITFVKKKQ